MPVPAIREHAGQRRDEQRRDLVRKAEQAQQEGGVGEAIHEPGEGHLLHPGTDQGDALTGEEQSVVPMRQARSIDHIDYSSVFLSGAGAAFFTETFAPSFVGTYS